MTPSKYNLVELNHDQYVVMEWNPHNQHTPFRAVTYAIIGRTHADKVLAEFRADKGWAFHSDLAQYVRRP
jgi:hypothetical protein